MKVRAAALLLALAGTASGARAQAPDTTSAAWVVEMFYGRPAFPGLAAHVTGEFAEHYAGGQRGGLYLRAARLHAADGLTQRVHLRRAGRAGLVPLQDHVNPHPDSR